MQFLPKAWRFVIYNDTGVSLDFSSNSANESASAQFVQANLDTSNGVSSYDGSSTTHSASTDIGNGSTETLTNVTGEDDLNMHGIFSVTTDNTSASGDVILGIESSPDGGTTWPSDSTNWDPSTDLDVIAVVNLSGAEAVDKNFYV